MYLFLTVCVFKFSMLDKSSLVKSFIIKFLAARFAFLRNLNKRIAQMVAFGECELAERLIMLYVDRTASGLRR